jgi:hypothetical protein
VLAELMAGHMGFADTGLLFPGFGEKGLGYLS